MGVDGFDGSNDAELPEAGVVGVLPYTILRGL